MRAIYWAFVPLGKLEEFIRAMSDSGFNKIETGVLKQGWGPFKKITQYLCTINTDPDLEAELVKMLTYLIEQGLCADFSESAYKRRQRPQSTVNL